MSLLDGVGFVFPPFLLVSWQTLPAKGQAPVEVASVVVLAVWGRFYELKSVEVDAGYVGADDGGAVLGDASQQWLQPPVKAFTCDTSGTEDASTRQPPGGRGAGQSHTKANSAELRGGEGREAPSSA